MTTKNDIAALDARVPYGVDHDLVLASLQSPGLPRTDEVAARRTARTTQAALDGVTSVDSVEAWAGEHTVSVAEPLTVGLPYDFRQSLTVTFNGELAAGGAGERMLMVVSLVDSEGEIISDVHPLAAGISGAWTYYAGGGFWKYAQLNTAAVMEFPAGSRAVEVALYPWDENSGLATVTNVSMSGQISTGAEYRGTGSPEGKLSAPAGSIYTDTAATNGAIRWIKTSGAGNTGWRVEYGDTGGRNISSYFSHLTTSTSSNLSIHRFGNSVELVIHAVTFDVGGVSIWSNVANLPAGFAPRTAFRQMSTLPSAMLEFRPDGEIRTTGTAIEKDAVVSFRVQWITTDPWPTSLPGLPV